MIQSNQVSLFRLYIYFFFDYIYPSVNCTYINVSRREDACYRKNRRRSRRGIGDARKFPGMLSQVRTDYRTALARVLTEQWINLSLLRWEARYHRAGIVGRRALTRVYDNKRETHMDFFGHDREIHKRSWTGNVNFAYVLQLRQMFI